MSFGNRRPGVSIKPPALARHVAVRLLHDESPRWISIEPDDARDRWERLLECLEDHVTAVRDLYGDPRPATFVRPEDGAAASEHVYCVRGSCIVPVAGAEQQEGFRLRLRVDVHKEICSITYLLDRIGEKGPEDALLPALVRQLPRDVTAFDRLVDDIWQGDPQPKVATAAVPWLGGGGFGPASCKIGRKLVEFRSVILEADAPVPEAARPATGKFAERAPVSSELLPAIKQFAEQNPRLICRAAGEDCDQPGMGEPVVCGMLDGAALYSSRLGSWSPQRREIEPIRHLLVYAGDSSEQLGRLVRRMHVLGQLRHAALMDFAYDEVAPIDQDEPMPALRQASDDMRALGQALSDESSLIATPLKMPELDGAIPRLVEINNSVPGGLTYRVERARRYSAEFQNTIEHLRTVKLRHWVAYDDFAKRHILHLLDRVDHIGRRYEALSERVQRLLTFRYTKKVQEELTVIDDATKAMKEASTDQRKLLHYAHLFAIMFSVYYIGSVFDHLLDVSGPAWLRISHSSYYASWGVAMAAAVAYVLVKLAQPKIRQFLRWLRAGGGAETRLGGAATPVSGTTSVSGTHT